MLRKSTSSLLLAVSFCMISVLAVAQKQNNLNMQANKLGQTLYYIQKMYLDTANIETLTNKALAAMVTELDPHSSYITKEDIKAMDEPLVGNFDGIGVEFALINDTLTINATIPGGPAEKVGVRAGDKIVSVDDETIAGTSLTIERVHKYLRGPKGTKVKVGVVRKGEPQVLEFVITRDKIPLNSIDSYYEIKDGIVYIRLTRFAATSYDELLKALQSVAVEPKGIVYVPPMGLSNLNMRKLDDEVKVSTSPGEYMLFIALISQNQGIHSFEYTIHVE